jgi:hypothetical protein
MLVDHVTLLKELAEWSSAGFYKHCAPNGAETRSVRIEG